MTEIQIKTQITPVIDRYIAVWNESDASRRRDLIAQTWTEDAHYVDPLVNAEGRDAIDATVAAAQAQFPGHVFRLAGPIDTHHNLARFTWELVPEGGNDAVAIGFDVALLADGQLQDVYGFLDFIPVVAEGE